MAQAQTKVQEATNITDSLLNSWANSIDRVYTSQKELENLFLQAIENQKETLVKVTGDLGRIEAEQKKLIEELRESFKLNIQSLFGVQASKAFETWSRQFDDVSGRFQQLTATPYKESLNLFNQSQEQFQETMKKGIDQQQKIRDEFASQLKTTQKTLMDLYEANTKVALGLFK